MTEPDALPDLQAAAQAPPARVKRHGWRRLLRVLLVVVLTLGAAWLFRRAWLPSLVTSLLPRVGASLGLELSCETVTTDGWRRWAFHGLRLSPQEAGPLETLTIETLELDASPWQLWREGPSALASLHLSQVELATRLAATPSEPAAAPDITVDDLLSWWRLLPTIHLEGLRWQDEAQPLLQLDAFAFLPADIEQAPRLTAAGPALKLDAALELDQTGLSVELASCSLNWQAAWQRLLPTPVPSDLALQLSTQGQARLPWSQPQTGTWQMRSVEITGGQAGAHWEARLAAVQGQGFRAEESSAAPLHFAVEAEDLPRALAAWGQPEVNLQDWGVLRGFSLSGTLSATALTLEQAKAHSDLARLSLAPTSIPWQGLGERWQLGPLELIADLELEQEVSLADGRRWQPGHLHGGLRLEQPLPWPPTRESSWQGQLLSLAWEPKGEGPWLRLRQAARVAWEPPHLSLQQWQVDMPAGSLSAEAELLAAHPSLNPEDWQGSLRVSAEEVDLAALQAIPGVPALPLQAGHFEGGFEASGQMDSLHLRSRLTLRQAVPAPKLIAELDSMAAWPARFDLELQAEWQAGHLQLEQGSYRDDAVQLTVQGEMATPPTLWEGSRETWEEGPLQVQIQMELQDQAWLTAYLPEAMPWRAGQLALEAQAEGTLAAPALTWDWQAEGWQAQDPRASAQLGHTLSGHGEGQYQAAAWHATSQWQADGEALAALNGEGQGDAMRLQLDLPAWQLRGLPWRGTATARAEADFEDGQWELQASIQGRELQPLEHPELPAVALDSQWTWGGAGLRLESLQASGPHLQAQASASMALPFAPAAWSALDWPQLATAGSLHIESEDLRWLDALDGIRRLQGYLQSDAQWQGTLSHPGFEATLALKDAGLRLREAALPEFSGVNLLATLQRDGLTIREGDGMLGASPFTLEGTLGWAEGQPDLGLRLEGEDLLLYRSHGMKLRADSLLTLTGTWPECVVGGELHLTDARIVENIPLLRSPVGPPRPPSPQGLTLFRLAPPLDRLRFDLALTADEGLSLRSNLVRGRLRPDLRLTGSGEVPALQGSLFLENMVMELPATRLYLRPSLARFLEDDPFHPRLELVGEASLQGYEVQVTITGPYDQPQVLFTSTPPLPQEDLLILLTTGQPPADRLDRRAAAGTAALYLARDFLNTFFGDDDVDAEASLLDRLEIEFGRDQTRNGVETLRGRFLLKQAWLGEEDRLYLQGGRDAFEDFFLDLAWSLRFR